MVSVTFLLYSPYNLFQTGLLDYCNIFKIKYCDSIWYYVFTAVMKPVMKEVLTSIILTITPIITRITIKQKTLIITMMTLITLITLAAMFETGLNWFCCCWNQSKTSCLYRTIHQPAHQTTSITKFDSNLDSIANIYLDLNQKKK
jgi:hypothetical protein